MNVQLFTNLDAIKKYKKGEPFRAFSEKTSTDSLIVSVPVSAIGSVENNLDYEIFNIKPMEEWDEVQKTAKFELKPENSGSNTAGNYVVESNYENDELVLKTKFATKDLTLTFPKDEIENNVIEETMRVVMVNTLLLAQAAINKAYEDKQNKE
jgi:hypothetical protein